MKIESDILLSGSNLASVRGGRVVYTGLNIQLMAGALITLEGPNGSGKSTLIRQLAGLLSLTAGTLQIAGLDVAEDPGARSDSLHFSGHTNGLKPAFDLATNLTLYSETVLGFRPNRSVLEAATASFDLAALLDTPIRYFSSGQQHRSALARLGLAHRPIWLLDEPTVGLDQANRDRLRTQIELHLAAGGGAIIATHDDLGIAGDILQMTEFRGGRDDPEAWLWD